MAQKTTINLIDDLDGQVLEDGQGETIRFALGNTSYEIDLSVDNAKALKDAIAPYINVARSTSARRSSTTSTANRNDKGELAAARSWLRENGHQVSDRGRIPAALTELYRARG